MGTPPPPGNPYEEPRIPWTPPPFGQTAPRLAGRWRRLFAGITDAVLVGLVTSPLTVDTLKVASDMVLISVRDGLLVGVIGFFYYWLLQSFWKGQTVGKRLFGMRVVRENGEPAGPGPIAVRQAVEIVLCWVCCLGLVNLAWILFDRRRQALHDKAAGTLVVDA
ncbi:RDD family protein [Microbispora hainanensis]|uniref:RDD family protein n=1 Tax=Microbispora hainanensis TaxID=568844 RepID=A0A544YTI3_9ACTN|nr:RDD family protein [Microbispora hainanensis]TQS20095.1 RDD family protein [Microbispora hainanensis]